MFSAVDNMAGMAYSAGMDKTTTAKPKRYVRVCGISFDPPIWARLEEEAAKMDRPNRSLVVERALRSYFERAEEGKERTDAA